MASFHLKVGYRCRKKSKLRNQHSVYCYEAVTLEVTGDGQREDDKAPSSWPAIFMLGAVAINLIVTIW